MVHRKTYRKFYSQRRFGVELELGSDISKRRIANLIKSCSDRPVKVAKYSQTSGNDFWHVKEDATCGPRGRSGPRGVEVASFIGSGSTDISHVSDVVDKLACFGCSVNNNCGLHVHVDVADLHIEQLGWICAWWIKCELPLSMALPLRRLGNTYCKFIFPPFLGTVVKNGVLLDRSMPLSPHFSGPTFFTVLTQRLRPPTTEERRCNLNLTNIVSSSALMQGKTTLELRWPEGSIKSLDVRCWTKFFLLFIDSCKNKGMPQDLSPCGIAQMMECLGLHDDVRPLVLSPSLTECKRWLLDRIMKHLPETKKLYSKSLVRQYLREASDLSSAE